MKEEKINSTPDAKENQHYMVAEYDEDGKLTRFCAKCGKYMTDESHIREENPFATEKQSE